MSKVRIKRKRKSIKLIIFLLIAILTISLVPLTNMALADANPTYEVDVVLEALKPLKRGETVPITVSLKNATKPYDGFLGYFEYDTNVFEELREENLVPDDKWNDPIYVAYNGCINMDSRRLTNEDQTILTINLKVKSGANISSGSIVKFTYINVAGAGTDLTAKDTVEYDVGEYLYLKSIPYKIGNDNIDEYQAGDQYISRVRRETTLSDFKNNLITNGAIKVLKQNGEVLPNDKYVGTGMTLVVTKGTQEIRLKIAVTGDLDGNGRVTATDLAVVKQEVLRVITLTDEYAIAGDTDESEKITATDLSDIKQMILRVYKD